MTLNPDGTTDDILTLTEVNYHGIVAVYPTAFFTQLPGQVAAGVFYIDVDGPRLPNQCSQANNNKTDIFQYSYHSHSSILSIRHDDKGTVYFPIHVLIAHEFLTVHKFNEFNEELTQVGGHSVICLIRGLFSLWTVG